MRKTGYYKQDWFVALLVGLLFAAAVLTRHDLLERLELAAYDLGVRATYRLPGAAEEIAIVAVDDQSISEIGRWPWPRNVVAGVLEQLAQAEPRAVAVLLDLTEPQGDGGLAAIRDLRAKVDAFNVPKEARAQFEELRAQLDSSEKTLDTDRALAAALQRTPRLHLPLYTAIDGSGAADADALAFTTTVTNVTVPDAELNAVPTAAALRPPLARFAQHASGIGHLSFRRDADNGARAFHPVLEHQGRYYPSLALLLAAASMNLDARHLEFAVGRGVQLGRLFVPTDASGHTHTGFHQPTAAAPAFAVYSFRDVQTDKVPASAFTNKLVLLGLDADGAGTKLRTPANIAAPEAEAAANIIAGILNQDFYTTPAWNERAQRGIALLVLLYLMFALPRFRSGTGLVVSLLVLVSLVGAVQFLLVTQKLWLHAIAPALLLVAGHFAIALKRLLLGERRDAETDSEHSNRLLGLTFQSQGQLDMAMDKFRTLPPNESVLDLIYNLALDFERKRQFHKAAAAYDYILDHRPGFRDCAERKQRTSQGGPAFARGTLLLDGAEKPTLGRYQIERELGRGEMGVVYLGRDPKINRQVAIKTIALSQEFEAKELGDVRERFFREAETAGRLHHPNIVTIYDVGEEHDLAYIAMEYLEGKELAAYITRDKPLPFDWIIDVAIKIADALAYAHRNDVVHRDIKPSNIVYHEATGGVKVMDFGIARITAASRTRTGTVLGTPAYMSPEQIAGKRVDGRSDLYSFGSMLFELVTGDTPFDGDSFAALMHQVINSPAPDVRKLRPDTPARLAALIKRLLHKQVTKRYQSGEEAREALEQCRENLPQTAKA